MSSIDLLEMNSCLRFVPRVGSSNEPYIRFSDFPADNV